MIITDSHSLNQVCCEVIDSNAGFICVDTEFHSDNNAYYPTLCLVQLGYLNKNFVIDVIAAGDDIDYMPLKKIMILPSIVKVFHGSRTDLLCIKRLIGEYPIPVFDTQIAEMMCEPYENYIGYATLVKNFLG